MRIVIAGSDEMALQFARELADQHDLVIIDDVPDLASRFERLDVQILREDPTHVRVLRELELKQGDRFIACAESDEKNIIACLAARQTGEVHTTCFVSKEAYAVFARIDRAESVLDIDRIVWPQQLLAEEISRIVFVPRAIDVESFAEGRIRLEEYRLGARSALTGTRLSRLEPLGAVLAVALTREERLEIPSGATRFQEGDKITFMGTPEGLHDLERRYLRDVVERVREVTIIGGGNVGHILARQLEQKKGMHVRLIESDRERAEWLASELPRTLVLLGDGTDLDLLETEQIYRSDVLVSVTSDDETNLLCSLVAREMEIPKVITRVGKPSNIYLFERVGVDVPLNPRMTAVAMVINELRGRARSVLATIEQGKGQVIEVDVPAELGPTRLASLTPVEGVVVGAVLGGSDVRIPHGGDTIRGGDRLLIFCTREGADNVEDLFRGLP